MGNCHSARSRRSRLTSQLLRTIEPAHNKTEPAPSTSEPAPSISELAPNTTEPVPNTSEMEFEVFLCFRGPDTRDNFTSCLYHDMVEKGIRVFKDDEELRVGQKIGRNLLQALDDTQIYIPIFSRGFASSPWCLREVAHMVDCTSKSDGKKQILPVFFDVKPDDVKLKTELYRDALSKHLEKYGPDEVKCWENALVEVPTRVGWRLEGQGYGELIGSIVREVQLKLKVKNRSLPDHLVEMDDEKAIEELLDIDSNGVCFVIIHGTGGIGKSTLAKVIFNRFLSEFDYSSFLEDVQDLSQRHDLLHVQKKLLSDTLGSTSIDGLYDTNDGINRIRKGFSNKKVMVVIDNVTEKKQIENLAGSYKWFGSGSRIIITMRDKRAILDRTIPNEDNQTGSSYYMDYPVKEMPYDRAIQLFSKHAFRSDAPPKDWHNFSVEVVSSIGRLPLTLEVVGSLFARTVRSEWGETLKDLKQVPCDQVRDTLMISFNKLDHRKREIFLDIACFCIGEDKTHAYYMWDDCGYSPRSAIEDLLLMSLIKIDEDNKFKMHDELRDLGRYIVKEENFEDARKSRWVRIDENTSDIPRSNEEHPAVRALSLGFRHALTPEELACFPMLRFLKGQGMIFVGDFRNLLHNLRWLSWNLCPMNFGATNLHLVNLVVLDLSHSEVTHKWDGWRQLKMVKKLKVLDLSWCWRLIKTPDFSEFGKLEKLNLSMCEDLSTIDSSIGKLKQLRTLDISGCNVLQGLPEEIGSLECLSEIIMSKTVNYPTSKPFKLPDTLGNLKSMIKFTIRSCKGIYQLPHSIGRLANLTCLCLHGCSDLLKLPNSIGDLESLIELDLSNSSISVIPDSIENLKKLKVLNVASTCIHTIPCGLGKVGTLEELYVSSCWDLLDKIPWEMWILTRLRILDLYGSPISNVPTKISDFSNLQTLKIDSSHLRPLPKLPSSLNCLVVKATCIPILPDLSNLVHLDHLSVGRKVPHNDSRLENRVVSIRKDKQSIHRLPRGLSTLELDWIPQLPDFSDIKSLSVLNISYCPMPRFPVLKYLESLRVLVIQSCDFLKSTPDLSCLKRLHTLKLFSLPKLGEIPGLVEVESLKSLEIGICNALEQLPNLSKLKNLQYIALKNCRKLRAVEGLEELDFLKTVIIDYCMSMGESPDVPAFRKLKTRFGPPSHVPLRGRYYAG